MLKLLVKARAGLVKGLEWAVMLVTGILVLDVMWQIITRFVLKPPSIWTEELARMLLIWVSLMGAALTFERKGHLGVDYFVGKLNAKAKKVAELAAALFVAVFSALVVFYGGILLVMSALSGGGQPSPALGIEWGHVYLALPISGFFIVLFSMETVVKSGLDLLVKKEKSKLEPALSE